MRDVAVSTVPLWFVLQLRYSSTSLYQQPEIMTKNNGFMRNMKSIWRFPHSCHSLISLCLYIFIGVISHWGLITNEAMVLPRKGECRLTSCKLQGHKALGGAMICCLMAVSLQITVKIMLIKIYMDCDFKKKKVGFHFRGHLQRDPGKEVSSE